LNQHNTRIENVNNLLITLQGEVFSLKDLSKDVKELKQKVQNLQELGNDHTRRIAALEDDVNDLKNLKNRIDLIEASIRDLIKNQKSYVSKKFF